MKTITLQTAVSLAIKELSALGSFSAYEITLLVRQRADRDYELSDVDQTFDSNLGTIYNIEHSRVREIILELMENGLFEATKSYGTNQQTGLAYVIFTPTNVQPATPTATLPIMPVVAATPAVAPAPVNNEIVDKITAYMASRKSSTIKKIQSALKIKGLTCQEIADLLPKNKKVNFNNSNISQTVVLR